METRIILIRHGETDWNAQHRIQGHVNIPLNPSGLHQAQLVAERLRPEPVAALYSSDLDRAKRTAEIIAQYHHMPVQFDARLRERNYGELEGLTREQIDSRFPDYQARNHAVAGQESLEQVKDRAIEALTEIAETHIDDTVLVVSHGGWINAVLYVLSNGRVGTGISKLKNTSISRIARVGEHWKIESIGDASHLYPVLY